MLLFVLCGGCRGLSRWSTSTARRCVSGDARRRPSLSEALRTTLAIAEALTEAHRHRLLHRDLKPSNAIIPRDGRPRVVDFGLATPLDAPVKGELDHPDGAAARIRGTPAYMAPEQWLGEPLTPACDIWALGVLLYELVGGERPFAGNAESLRARDRRGGATSAPWRERANVAGADRHALPRARALQAAEPV